MTDDLTNVSTQNQPTEGLHAASNSQPVADVLLQEESIEMMAMHYEGPVMPPHLLREIEKIIPGGADRVLQLSEKEQAHRHEIVGIKTKTMAWQIKASPVFGVSAFVFLICGILYCTIYGYTSGVVTLGGIGAFGVITHIIKLPKSEKRQESADAKSTGKK